MSNKACKKDRSIVVTCALLVSFSTSIANMALQWKTTNLCFIDNAQSMLATYTCSVYSQGEGYDFVVVILSYLQYIVADSLLVRPIQAILANTIQ